MQNANTEVVRNAKVYFKRNLLNGVVSNLKRFWKYVHNKTDLKQGIGALERSDGSLTSDESEMAELSLEILSLVMIKSCKRLSVKLILDACRPNIDICACSYSVL